MDINRKLPYSTGPMLLHYSWISLDNSVRPNCSHCSLTVPLRCGDVCNRPEVCINPPRNGAHKPPSMRCQKGSQHRGYTPGVPTVGLWLQRVESSAMQLGIIPIVWTWVIWYKGRAKGSTLALTRLLEKTYSTAKTNIRDIMQRVESQTNALGAKSSHGDLDWDWAQDI